MTDNAWVFPVGHYLGPFFPAKDAPLASHRVRVGQSMTNLFSDEEFAVWALAHGLPGHDDTRPWSRRAMVAAARGRGGGDVAGVVAALVEGGALVEVEPAAAAAFARGHRFQALLVGLGASAERPDRFHIGLTGQPLATVDRLAFEIWQWAPLQPTLWATCEALAAVDGVAPETMVDRVLDRVHTLLGAGAGYLDVSR